MTLPCWVTGHGVAADYCREHLMTVDSTVLIIDAFWRMTAWRWVIAAPLRANHAVDGACYCGIHWRVVPFYRRPVRATLPTVTFPVAATFLLYRIVFAGFDSTYR